MHSDKGNDVEGIISPPIFCYEMLLGGDDDMKELFA
jgi:hypothetical protein